MIINHDLKSQFLVRQNVLAQKSTLKAYEKLSSAKKINSAGDDASGLAVSEKFRTQIRGLHRAGKNAQDSISLTQAVDGYLNDMVEIMQRIRELAVQSSNGIYNTDERQLIQIESDILVNAVQKITEFADFNKKKIFSGNSFRFHIGANMNQFEHFEINELDTKVLGIHNLDIKTLEGSNSAIGKLDKALNTVYKIRADVGAFQNRLEKAYQSVMINRENTISSESMIRDTQMAETVSEFMTLNILSDSNALNLNRTHAMIQQNVRAILSR